MSDGCRWRDCYASERFTSLLINVNIYWAFKLLCRTHFSCIFQSHSHISSSASALLVLVLRPQHTYINSKRHFSSPSYANPAWMKGSFRSWLIKSEAFLLCQTLETDYFNPRLQKWWQPVAHLTDSLHFWSKHSNCSFKQMFRASKHSHSHTSPPKKNPFSCFRSYMATLLAFRSYLMQLGCVSVATLRLCALDAGKGLEVLLIVLA